MKHPSNHAEYFTIPRKTNILQALSADNVDHTPCSPFKNHAKSTGKVQRHPHELQNAQKRQQPQCNTARPDVDSVTLPVNDGDDCPNPRYPRSLKNAMDGRNILHLHNKRFANIKKTEAPISTCEIHILKMATL